MGVGARKVGAPGVEQLELSARRTGEQRLHDALVLLGEDEDAYLVGAGETRRLDCPAGTTVSVFPFACPVCTVSYTGMRYPLDHGDLYSDLAVLPMGVSNVAEESPASVAVHSGLALVLVTKTPV